MNGKGWLEELQRWAGIAALVVGAIWAYYKWNLSGADDWMVNLDIVTEVLPYSGDLRLLVVHVKSKNPTGNQIEFKRKASTFVLTAREVLPGLAEGARIEHARTRELVHPVDLMATVGESYVFMPGAEFDDMQAIVVRANATILLTAELTRKDAPRSSGDFVSAERLVRIAEK